MAAQFTDWKKLTEDFPPSLVSELHKNLSHEGPLYLTTEDLIAELPEISAGIARQSLEAVVSAGILRQNKELFVQSVRSY